MAADLAGRAAVVTGASGIGAATAERFLAAGAGVHVVDKDPERVAVLRETHPELGGSTGDLRDEVVCDEVVRDALDAFGRLDVLVNVAGLSGRRFGDGPTHEATAEGWDMVMDSNARSTFLMCRAALRVMVERRAGVIVNTASVLAYAPNAEHFATHAYAASKGAILALTRSMAAYYARYGIRVNAVAPGLIATPMSRRAQEDPAILGYLERRQPLAAGPGRPDDVAEAALYLASDASRFVTGTHLEVAGGWGVSG